MALSFCLFTLLPTTAQSFTQRAQQVRQGQGTLRIHHNALIDQLVNGPRRPEKPKTPEKPKEKKEEKRQPIAQRDTTHHDDEQPDTLAQKNRRYRKATGFRIQVFAGGSSRQDRIKAESTGSMLRQLFPTESVYVHYSKPRWLCRLGNFTERELAEEMLVEVRKAGYPNATIVRDRVSVPY